MRWVGNIIRHPDRLGLLALAVVYLVWGSTYLAIREAVRGDGAIPPFALGAVRMGLASGLLFAVAAARGESCRLTLRGSLLAALGGLLLWVGGNGLVIVGLRHLDTGLAAVLMATTPLWLVLLTALHHRRLPSQRALLGVLLGFAGVGLLVISTQAGGLAASGAGVALLLLAALSWALGSMLPRPGATPLVNAASIMWFAAIGFAVISAARGEPLAVPSLRASMALLYLIVIGSGVGFVAYLIAVERLPLPMVMTHAQVNPLVAVLLGVAFVGESISALAVLAGGLIVASIPLSR